VAAADVDPIDLRLVVRHSLDRKVCNTLNTLCLPKDRAETLIPAALAGLEEAASRRDTNPKLHVVAGQEASFPDGWFDAVGVSRAAGVVQEPKTETLEWDQLGLEWEWEDSPEISIALVDSVDHAVELFNVTSPRFVACLVGGSEQETDHFFDTVDAPFVGNGFTRWVDGQYALDKPELGLSNWQFGRLFGRGGVLSGDSVFTVRTRVYQDDLDIGR
jgi:glutamate-5-semialdehyde dehydrogenase